MNYKNKIIIAITIILLFLIAYLPFPGGIIDPTDVKDYSDTAKFFAGEYKAKLRTSHSILYGLLLSPYIKLSNSFFLLKFVSAFWLTFLILSIYYISGKNKRTLLLFITMPLIWYMAPWLSPLPLVSLLFIWAYYFYKKFDREEKIKYLIFTGILFGIASALWNTFLYFSFIFLIAFMYDKKLYYSFVFLLSIFIGLLPNLIVDKIFFGSAFYSIIKHSLASIAFALYGGIYEQGFSSPGIINFILVIIFIPFYFYLLFKKKNFQKYKKETIFLILSLLFSLTNPQVRIFLSFMPILILIFGEILNGKQFKLQIIMFLILSVLVVLPYITQAKYEINKNDGLNFDESFGYLPRLEFSEVFAHNILKDDLKIIEKEYPNQIFLVGNDKDFYRKLAHVYWGNKIKEFISIEDYKLWLNNKTLISKKRISSNAVPEMRREIWIEVGIGKNSNDKTDYDSIKYAIGFDKNFELQNFKLITCYKKLCIFENTKI